MKIKSYIDIIFGKLQGQLFNKAIRGKNAWRIFDKAGLEGFGVNLIRLYFPIYYNKKQVRDSFSGDLKKSFTALFDQAAEKRSFSADVVAIIPKMLKLPVTETDQKLPYLDNYYFGVLDAAVLGAMMKAFAPKKIVEIGSGISSRYISYFKNQFGLSTDLICIDPFPRAEIVASADVLIRKPLEDVIGDPQLAVQHNDIIFMDGSHYVFQGNDTLNFFFKLLPALPSGVIIHIHDIYLPEDYAENVTSQLWTEQYILAAMIVGGFEGYEVLCPAYYMSKTDKVVIQALSAADEQLKPKSFKLRNNHTEGFSFWMRKK